MRAGFGTDLPSDYVEFIARYGTGCTFDFLYVLNPFSRLYNVASLQLMVAREFRESAECDPDFDRQPLFPEPGGLLFWGATFNGDRLAWKTDGEPDKWTIDVYDGKYFDHEHFDVNFASFLCAMGNRTLVSDIFPPYLLESLQPGFRAVRGLT